jgi:hypothetical protein
MVKSGRLPFLLLPVLAGCGAQPDSAYMSTSGYMAMDCAQIQTDATVVAARASDLIRARNATATQDQVIFWTGFILFGPVVYLMTDSDEEKAQIADLRQQIDALEQASIAKDCGIAFRGTTLSPSDLAVQG